jgi:HEAT repeat protein
MRRHHTTHADEIARHEHFIELLARRPAIRKLQHALDSVCELWAPPDYLRSDLGGSVHWRVQPSKQAVTTVAAYHDVAELSVRRAAYAALRYAAPHKQESVRAIVAGLRDLDVIIRIQAARAAAALGLEDSHRVEIERSLADPVWAVRWSAALALSRTDARASVISVLLNSQPAQSHRSFHEWAKHAKTFVDVPEIRHRLQLL